MNNKYEAVIVFDPDLSDAAVQAEISTIENLVKQHQGLVTTVDIWGKRQLAYKINKRETGIYLLLVLEGDNKLVGDLDRQLKINEKVLRHLVVSKNKFAPDLSPRAREMAVADTGAPFEEEVPELIVEDETELAVV